MPKKDYYNILGINKNATKSQIEAAYKRKAREWHPDMWKRKSASAAELEKAETMFKDIGEAYEILSDQNKKWVYDHDTDKPNYGDGNEGSPFECAGCHNSSTYHYHEISQGSQSYIFCGYDCLFDCANPLCISGGKCYKWLIKSRSDGNFCSRKCLAKFRKRKNEYGDFDDDSEKCDKCHGSLKGKKSYRDNWGRVFCASCSMVTCEQCQIRGIPLKGSDWVASMGCDFCSQSCLNKWIKKESSSQNYYDLEQKRESFIERVERLADWELLSANERNSFRSQIYQAKPVQFAEIYQSIQLMIKSKKGETDEGDSHSSFVNENPPSGNQLENDKPTEDNDSPSSNSPSTPESSSVIDYQRIKTVPPEAARSLARAYINDLLRNSGVKPEQLDDSCWTGFSDWESCLSSIDDSKEIANFLAKMESEIIKAQNKNSESSFWDRNRKTILITGGIIGVILIIGAIIYYWKKEKTFYCKS